MMKQVPISVAGTYPTPLSEVRLTYSTTDPEVEIHGSSIEIPFSSRVQLQFELHATEGGKQMIWPKDPVKWKEEPAPSGWSVERVNDTLLQVTEPGDPNGSYSFFLHLEDQTTRVHASPDPTVVIKGPPGRGEEKELAVWWHRLRREEPGAAREVLALARKIFTRR